MSQGCGFLARRQDIGTDVTEDPRIFVCYLYSLSKLLSAGHPGGAFHFGIGHQIDPPPSSDTLRPSGVRIALGRPPGRARRDVAPEEPG
jgi:hypothetical protein